MKIVTLVNRLPTDFEFMFNGEPWFIPGGGEVSVPVEVAQHGVQRAGIVVHNPETHQSTTRLGIRDLTDCSPLPEEVSRRIELLDRTDMEERARRVEVVPTGISQRSIGTERRGADSGRTYVAPAEADA